MCLAPCGAGAQRAVENAGSSGELNEFAGRWLVDNGNPGGNEKANIITLQVDGGKVTGTGGAKGDRFDLDLDGPGVLKGVLRAAGEPDMPLTVQLSRDGQRLILELAPPQSEFITVTAKRIGKAKAVPAEESAAAVEPSATVDPALVRRELKEASDRYKELVEKGEREGLAEARERYRAALAKARGQDGQVKPSAGPETAAASGTKSTGVRTEEEAVERVARISEVRDWKKQVEQAAKENPGLKAMLRAEDNGKRFTVQVFEVVPDSPDESHTATFGWYAVDKKDGRAYSIMQEIIDGTAP
jgi:hypothetical protein